MDAKEFLMQIQKYDALIRGQRIEIDRLRQAAKIPGNGSYCREKVQMSKSIDQMENKIIAYTELEGQLQERILHYWMKRAEVIAVVEQLNAVEYDFMYKVYVAGKKLQEVADMSDRSYSWATSTHARALKNVQKILDRREIRRGDDTICQKKI